MTQIPATLICPKCGADMRTYERNGVVIDQCTACRGIFLDRGELEALFAAENSYYGSNPAQPPQAGGYQETRGGEQSKHGGGHDQQYGGGHGQQGGRRKPGGFLGGLFD